MKIIFRSQGTISITSAIALAQAYGLTIANNLVKGSISDFFAIFTTETKSVAFFNKINRDKTSKYISDDASMSYLDYILTAALVAGVVKIFPNSDGAIVSGFGPDFTTNFEELISKANPIKFISTTVTKGSRVLLGIDDEAQCNIAIFLYDSNGCITTRMFNVPNIEEILGCNMSTFVKHAKETIPKEKVISASLYSEASSQNKLFHDGSTSKYGIIGLRNREKCHFFNMNVFLESIDLNMRTAISTLEKMDDAKRLSSVVGLTSKDRVIVSAKGEISVLLMERLMSLKNPTITIHRGID